MTLTNHLFEGKTLLEELRLALREESSKLFTPPTPANHRNASCEVEWCGNVAYAKNLCNGHYIRLRSGKDMALPFQHRSRKSKCSECESPVDGKGGWGLCKSHYNSTRRRIIREVSIAHLGGSCRNCGGAFPPCVYDFHHRDPALKLFDPSEGIGNRSIESIALEIEKCDLLCANCHRIEHHG